MENDTGFRKGLSLAFRLGVELVVAVAIGALMGYAVDYYWETQPWGLAIGFLLGGAAGCLNVYRTAVFLQEKESEEKDSEDPPENPEN